MKLISACSILLLCSNIVFAKQFKVVDRDKKFKTVIKKQYLTDLTSKTSFEGKYFKIVEATSNQAISFDSKEKLKLKAATVYYHLTKARSYFVNKLESDFIKNYSQITIRLNLTNKFNDLGKFANVKNDPQFNNAVTIPSGKGFASRGVEPWQSEIWFRPSKIINVKELGGYDQQSREVKSMLYSFRKSTHMMTFRRFLTNLILGDYGNLGNETLVSSLFRTAGSSFIIETAYQTTGIVASKLSRQQYSLEAALVPEIIYHEFSHLVLSDEIDINTSTPLNEGMADYFAGKIAESEALGLKSKYNLFSGKEVDRDQLYKSRLESSDYANADFVFGLLWQIDEELGNNNDKFIFNLRKNIDANGTIRDDLVNSIMATCRANCKNPLTDSYSLYLLFDKKGL